MAIPDVEANGFAMELLESRLIRIVDKHKLLYLVLVSMLPPNQGQLTLTSGKKRMKKAYPSKKR